MYTGTAGSLKTTTTKHAVSREFLGNQISMEQSSSAGVDLKNFDSGWVNFLSYEWNSELGNDKQK